MKMAVVMYLFISNIRMRRKSKTNQKKTKKNKNFTQNVFKFYSFYF